MFEVSEGWGPLCAFLGVPEPDGPFPRVNDTRAMQRKMRTVRVAVNASAVLSAAAAGLAIARLRAKRRGLT